jgi:hypothetical protein
MDSPPAQARDARNCLLFAVGLRPARRHGARENRSNPPQQIVSSKMLFRLVCVMLLGCVAACDTAPAGVEGEDDKLKFLVMDAIEPKGAMGIYTAKRDDRETKIEFALPVDKIDPLRLHFIEQVDETASGVVVVIDRYATRITSDKRCEKGVEAFLRVFSLAAKKQLMAEPIESCLNGLTASDPPVTWLGGDNFRIEGRDPKIYAIENVTTVRRIN